MIPEWRALVALAAGLCWQHREGRPPTWDPEQWRRMRAWTLPMVTCATYAAFASENNHMAAERYLKAHPPPKPG